MRYSFLFVCLLFLFGCNTGIPVSENINTSAFDHVVTELKPLSEECRRVKLVNLWLELAHENSKKHEYVNEKYFLCYAYGFYSMQSILVNGISEGTGDFLEDVSGATEATCNELLKNEKMWTFFSTQADTKLKPYVKQHLSECFEAEQHEYLNGVLDAKNKTSKE